MTVSSEELRDKLSSWLYENYTTVYEASEMRGDYLVPHSVDDIMQLITADRNALLDRLTKKSKHYTADGLVADALDPWAVPMSVIEAERGRS